MISYDFPMTSYDFLSFPMISYDFWSTAPSKIHHPIFPMISYGFLHRFLQLKALKVSTYGTPLLLGWPIITTNTWATKKNLLLSIIMDG